MQYSEFGKEFKKILIERDLRIYDIAKKLNVSSAFISSIITGRKNVPENFVDNLVDYLQLSKEESELLQEAANKSRDTFKVDMSNCNELAKSTFYEFQRSLNDLDNETLRRLNEILKNRGDK